MFNVDFETPILFIVFNRPDCTRRVFESIRSIRPKRLFVAADGPRADRPGEDECCSKVREIISLIDWECEAKTLFRDTNLGCKEAVTDAINWFFENVEEGIVLEDDCLPNETFFRYCSELLKKYRDDKRVMHIAGTNFQRGWSRDTDYSYYFSYFGSIWGWATWRRAWNLHDINMPIYPEIKLKGYLKDLCTSKEELEFRLSVFDQVFSGKLNTWDYQWSFSKIMNSGLAIVPKVNLITNIGFDSSGTHTKGGDSLKFLFSVFDMHFPLKHPPFIIRDTIMDTRFVNLFLCKNKWNRIKDWIKRCFIR